MNQAPIPSSLLTQGFALAAAALALNNLVYIKADGTMDKADATAQGKEAIAFLPAAVGNGQAGQYFCLGVMTGLTGLTPGAAYYMDTTAGGINVTPPSTAGNVVLKIGTALSATTLLFKPEAPVTL